MKAKVYGVILCIISILLISSLPSHHLGDTVEAENPYGKGVWEWHDGNMWLIRQNGSDLVNYHTPEIFNWFRVEVVDENQNWATLKITWDKNYKNLPRKSYWENRTIPDYDNFKLKVKKSNNLAYFERTDEVFGFNPFYVYEHVTPDMVGEDGKGNFELDQKYMAVYGRGGYSTETFELDNMSGVSSMKNIRCYRSHQDMNLSLSSMDVVYKQHYPGLSMAFIPAEILIKNVTDEKFVHITANLDESQEEAIDFIKSISCFGAKPEDGTNGQSDDQNMVEKYAFVGLIGVGILSVIVAYIGYRKAR